MGWNEGEKREEKEQDNMEMNSFFDEEPEDEVVVLRKKSKNLLSLLILVGGLFIGSLYVDVAGLVSKSGFSPRILSTTDVVSANGKTWVAYSEPIVRVTALTDSTCKDCNIDEAIVSFRRAMPTISVEQLDIDKDASAKTIAAAHGIKSVPAFIFSKEIADTAIFEQASQAFKKSDKGDDYVLDIAQVGIPAGRYLETPEVESQDFQVGSTDAKVHIVEFSDFQCPYCKAFQTTIDDVVKEYGDKVFFAYKNYPLPIHPFAEPAANAALCAKDQEKFQEYGDLLFSKQDEWSKLSDPSATFEKYARQLGLNSADFSDCLKNKSHQAQIDADKAVAESFGLTGTPGTFVNGRFLNGAVTKDDLKKAIDEELGSSEEK